MIVTKIRKNLDLINEMTRLSEWNYNNFGIELTLQVIAESLDIPHNNLNAFMRKYKLPFVKANLSDKRIKRINILKRLLARGRSTVKKLMEATEYSRGTVMLEACKLGYNLKRRNICGMYSDNYYVKKENL